MLKRTLLSAMATLMVAFSFAQEREFSPADYELEIKSILLDKNGEVLYEEKLTGSVREAETMGRKIGKEMLDYI